MKMKMSIKDRLVLPVLFPEKSDLQSQIIVKDIMKKNNISKDEADEICLETVNSGFKWQDEKAKDKEIDFNELEIRLLKKQVKFLDESNLITFQILELCLKIQDIELKGDNNE